MKNTLRKIVEKILKFFAQKLLDNLKPDIIAITGSVGKSSAKEAIFLVLSESKRFANKIWKNYGNLNEEIGVPLSILGFKKTVRWYQWPIILIACAIKVTSYKSRQSRGSSAKPGLQVTSYPKILVLELAANKPGDIQYLTSFIKPKISVVTAIGLAHTKTFGSLENIIKEKGYLIEVLSKDAWAVLNEDDPNVKAMSSRTKANIVFYHGEKLDSDQEAARAVGKIYGLSEQEISTALQDYQPLDHRMNIVEGSKDTIIIDDTYNANPLSMERALKKLSAESFKLKAKRRIAVLGDMLELGNYATQAHQEIAKKARLVVDLLITVGPNFSKTKANHHFANSIQAGEFLLKEMKARDIILVKGSRGMRMEQIVETLKATNNDTKHH